MAIYHLSVQMISRGSGRSAVSASAYRAGEKLRSHSHSVESAAYRAGEELRDGETVHDYTKRNGIMHKEIILPDNAPIEYKDRETLWNAVEKAEKRKNAQLAREINVALPTEFDLEEQKTLLREYIKENFVDRGMIADFAIHHTRKENPHAHIMLTTRKVTPDGFGNKNREWNSRQILVEWRKSWADKTNRMLEEKGIEERIDHRTLEAQGIDREPTIHLGAEAAALERRGIRTKRGDYNREIQRRNQERADLRRAKLKEREVEKAVQRVEKSAEQYRVQGMKDIEEYLRTEKAEQIVEKLREQRKARELAEINPRMDEIENEFFAFKWELRGLKEDCIAIRRDIPPLEYRAETIDEYAEVVNEKQKETAQLRERQPKTHFWEWGKRSCWDELIRQAERELKKVRQYFICKFKFEPEQAQEEIERLQKIVREKELEIAEKEARMNQIYDRQDVLRTEFHALKLRKDVYRDREWERAHDEELSKIIQIQIQSARERQMREQIIHELNTITEEGFQKALEKLSYEEAQALIEIRETAKEQGLIKERRRTRTIGRSR